MIWFCGHFEVIISEGVWALLKKISTQTLCLPPQNLLSFQCGADALEVQNKAFTFPASTTSRIVARLRFLRQRHHPLPLLPSTDTMGLFPTAIPGHTVMTWRSCRYLSSPAHSCLLKLSDWWLLDFNTQDDVKVRVNWRKTPEVYSKSHKVW